MILTGEQLYDIFQDHSRNAGNSTMSWTDLRGTLQALHDQTADSLNLLFTTESDPNPFPHVPSQLSPIVLLPRDVSWDQYYTSPPLLNEARIRALYTQGKSKHDLLLMFANLSLVRLDQILAEGTSTP